MTRRKAPRTRHNLRTTTYSHDLTRIIGLLMGNGFVIAHLLGAVQGVFLASILASRRQGSIANRILAVLMTAFALDLAAAVYHVTGYDSVFPHFIGIDYPLAFLYGPLLYLYARTLTHRERSFRRSYLWHFVPFGLVVLYLTPFYAQHGTEKLAYIQAPEEAGAWMQVLGAINHAKMVHGFVYLGALFVMLNRYRHRIRDTFSSTDRINLLWLRNLLIGIVCLFVISTVLYVFTLNQTSFVIGMDPAVRYDDYTLLGLALFVYATGFMGLRQPELLFNPWQASGTRHADSEPAYILDEIPSDSPSAVETGPDEKARYARSGMDPDTAARHKDALLVLMTKEKIYRNSQLTLQDLSDALGISTHNLTEVINTQFGQNFYDFVNGYRVREVQERLEDPQQDHYTLLAIGLDAGFNSKSSFNAVFKKHTGMTPSQYRKQAIVTPS